MTQVRLSFSEKKSQVVDSKNSGFKTPKSPKYPNDEKHIGKIKIFEFGPQKFGFFDLFDFFEIQKKHLLISKTPEMNVSQRDLKTKKYLNKNI